MTTNANARLRRGVLIVTTMILTGLIVLGIYVVNHPEPPAPATCSTATPITNRQCTVPLPSGFCLREDDCDADWTGREWVIVRTEH